MSEVAVQDGLLDRALRRVSSLWRDMAAAVGVSEQQADIAARLRDALDGRGGEVSARNRAAGLAEAYRALDRDGRMDFLRALAGFDSDPAAVARAMEAVAAAQDPAERAVATARLRRALEPPRIRLLTAFAAIPDGVKLLVEMRAALLSGMAGDKTLQALETDLKGLLAAWFDVAFLELRRIDWHSPAVILEKLVQYEAVHRIRTWRDLKNRLDSDRRCYAFFHPRMPEEPLIFVEVALVKGMSDSVQRLLDEKAPVLDAREADTAVFYSINNCQRGLDGISFGNFLIKRVVEVLGNEFRNIKTFCTLSPIPGYRRWLDAALMAGEIALTDAEEKALLALMPPQAALPAPEAGAPEAEGTQPRPPGLVALQRLLSDTAWKRDEAAQKVLEPILTRLCALYLAKEDAPGRPGRARDPVAHFHLSNGARIERLNWRGDVSENGYRQSAGLMVNYLYDPERIEENHEIYMGEGKRAVSTALRRLARA
ncbi:malonyl-CoA decarboxylase [Roseomonas alkaliterrae]|uniref:Malonyl-CoA decarboxylase n=1 Tax=Neoroseomonas alkaliterrae TaxID=1452450 RepID=A0A840Y586_9PROT|nr:malonyl-CoA decarboxylase family protein [Neoroseomonas alkaliterrae]MBB5691131.1 malonyl-CoA decarboxylase [Neoroseomonas alkaliterrae]MBR0678619.1 malonyl-CoA decarboxylase [Neoroseomonas alkaliterrae]